MIRCRLLSCHRPADERVHHPERGEDGEEILVCDQHAEIVIEEIGGGRLE